MRRLYVVTHPESAHHVSRVVGGWFDAENLFGALECSKSVEKNSPTATRPVSDRAT